MKKTIGILAHVDAGKTTFSEQLLYHTDTIKKRGRVDHQDTFLDTHEIEKERGITVFSDQAKFEFGNSTYFLIDTPGHIDFSPEMERAIQVMDYAIVIVSAIEGVEGHTETVWQLLRKHQIPTFFFINKTDREGADPERVLKDIHANLSADACHLTSTFNDGVMQDSLIEFLAERNETLLDTYLTTGYDQTLWLETFKKMIKESKLFPAASGSALKDLGIIEFLTQFDQFTETSYHTESPFSAYVYKIRHDENNQRVTYMKVLAGKLHVRDQIRFDDSNTPFYEKVNQMRMYNGESFVQVNEAEAGEIVAVIGLSSVNIGDRLGELKQKSAFEMIPILKSKVNFDANIPTKDMLACFKMLEAEDPSLQVIWDEHFQEIQIHVMGKIQLEVLVRVVEERFNYSVSFSTPEILYHETIANSVIGYGHFEPWKHYAEVHLKIEPAKRGSGITFANQCHANDLSIGNQNLIRQHIFERGHHGLLTGSTLTDVKITLLTGSAHNQHTKGGDFREATFRALRQGLEQANNILLEPYYAFKIKVDLDQIGRVMADIQKAEGSFTPAETAGDKATLTGSVPVATFIDYQSTFMSYTHGKGMLTLKYGGYDLCHNTEEIIEKINYQKDADPDYSSSSIFVAKGGKTNVIPWYEAKDAMHLLK